MPLHPGTDNFIMYDTSQPQALATMKPKKKPQAKRPTKIAGSVGEMEAFEEAKNPYQGEMYGGIDPNLYEVLLCSFLLVFSFFSFLHIVLYFILVVIN